MGATWLNMGTTCPQHRPRLLPYRQALRIMPASVQHSHGFARRISAQSSHTISQKSLLGQRPAVRRNKPLNLSAYARQPVRGPRLEAIWAHLGAMLAYLGPSWGYVGLSSRLCWPILGLCWPIFKAILGLCWPILRAIWAHLGAMVAHLAAYVGPCWPILSRKSRKMRIAKNTVNRGSFW